MMEKVQTLRDIQFNELDNYARIPRGKKFKVLYWQIINGQKCPVVKGSPYVKGIIYFTKNEFKPIYEKLDKTKS